MNAAIPDIGAAAEAVASASEVTAAAARQLAGSEGGVDANQVVAYDLAHASAALECARAAVEYGGRGEVEGRLAAGFVADAVHDAAARVLGREAAWGVEAGALDDALELVRPWRDPAYLATLAGEPGPRHLDSDLVLVQDTFRRFAEDEVRPVAEHVHRHNEDGPESIIEGLAEIGTFGVSVPEEYDGFGAAGEGEYLAMVVATEELSLGVAGSLITRPEILSRALVAGGTEEQKRAWLPRIASGELMRAVAVTEPDYGSDVANLRVAARPDADGWRINGVKTWCTFGGRADVLMVLARTDPDRSNVHRGLSVFIVPKERVDGHSFELTQPEGGRRRGGRSTRSAIAACTRSRWPSRTGSCPART